MRDIQTMAAWVRTYSIGCSFEIWSLEQPLRPFQDAVWTHWRTYNLKHPDGSDGRREPDRATSISFQQGRGMEREKDAR